MSESTDAPFDDQSPPTAPGPMDAPEMPARWPTPIGWLSTIFGILSLTCGGAGIVIAVFLAPQMTAMASQGGTPPPTMQFSIVAMGLMFFGLLWQIPLVIAGISTIMRKPVGRPLHLLYAIGFVVTTLPSSYIAWNEQQNHNNSPEMTQWVAENPKSPMAASMGMTSSPLMMIPGVALNLAWPTFCLIWFLPAGRSERALRQDEEDDLV